MKKWKKIVFLFYVCLYVCEYLRVCVFVCVCICVYVWLYVDSFILFFTTMTSIPSASSLPYTCLKQVYNPHAETTAIITTTTTFMYSCYHLLAPAMQRHCFLRVSETHRKESLTKSQRRVWISGRNHTKENVRIEFAACIPMNVIMKYELLVSLRHSHAQAHSTAIGIV